jgi:hypothetical protein
VQRLHLFEFEDQAWLPSSLQLLVTQALQRMNQSLGIYRSTVPLLERALERSGHGRIVDLCSGAGGPWPYVFGDLRERLPHVELTLTDRAPQPGTIAPWTEQVTGVTYATQPVDARRVPRRLEGLRTMFTGFHHFGPDAAKEVLGDAVGVGAPIAVFEFTRRRWRNVALAAVAGGLGLPVVTPWLRPFKLSHLLWAYLLPIAPLVYAWDGAISNLRTYRHDELRTFATEVSKDYVWEVGDVAEPRAPAPITYLLGWPRSGRPQNT